MQLLAVHGRTREQKDSRAHKADWDAIKVGALILLSVIANYLHLMSMCMRCPTDSTQTYA